MSNTSGFIKIHRSIIEWEWYKDRNTFSLFMHLVLTANHEEKQWRGITIKRGQLVTSRSKLSKATGLSEQEVKTCLKRLVATNEITIKSTNKESIITLCNYSLYQDSKSKSNQQINQQTNQRATSKSTSKLTSKLTSKKSTDSKPKKGKATSKSTSKLTRTSTTTKEDKEYIISSLRSEINITENLWNDWKDHLEAKKCPLTTAREKVQLNKLKNLIAKTGNSPEELIEHAIDKNWQSFYPISDSKKSQSAKESKYGIRYINRSKLEDF